MADLKDTLKELEDRMNKTISFMQEEFSAIRAGRANPHVLDRIT
ncbi:MAG: ribosome recycling factor, partial [Stomatobaculum longum]|nr:ribosome recycling factor [Stomatobaculum longum]